MLFHWVFFFCAAAFATGLERPTAPFMDLTVLSQSSINAKFYPPSSDGGADIYQYKVEWDTDPGVQEVQSIATSVYVGPNEVQAITTSATSIPEQQTVSIIASKIREVQRVNVSQATGGSFFLSLDTSSTGGSFQVSGNIEPNYPASGSINGQDVASIISAMNNIDGAVIVSKVGTTYLVTFPEAMGNVPEMSVGTSELTPKAQASVSVSTEVEGNVVGGSFRLEFMGEITASLSSQASANDVRMAIEALSTVGEVQVQRSMIDYQQGYSWTVTFVSVQNSGNVATLVPHSNLTTSNSDATVTMNVSSITGNQLGGKFAVSFTRGVLSGITSPIAFDASAADFKSALESIASNVIPAGTIAVSRTGPDEQLGYSWSVTFLDDFNRTFYGNQLPFSYDTTGLTGIGANVNVVKVFNGTFQEVQLISVTSASAIDPDMKMKLTFNGHSTGPIQVRPSGTTCTSNIVEVQKIVTSTKDTTTGGGDNEVSMYLQFRLQYGNEVTGWINANPKGMTECSTSATEIQNALQELSVFHTVSVSQVAGLYQTCEWTISFVSSIGNIDPLIIQARNQITGASGSYGSSSHAGDDSIAVVPLIDGQKDAIKGALELLNGVIGVVTVTPVHAVQDSLGACSWRVTFDSNAGDLTSMQVVLTGNNFTSSLGSSTSLLGVTVDISEIIDGTSSVIGGNFALSFRGARTYYLPYDASARDVQVALESLPTIGLVSVSQSAPDENNGYLWLVTFSTEWGALDLIVFDNQDMTGTMVNGLVAKKIPGVAPPFNSLDFGSNLPLGSEIVTDLSYLSVTVDNLDEGIPYYFRVAAINAVGQGPFAFSSVPFAIPQSQRPGRPIHPTLDPVDGKSLLVSFQPPKLDGGQDITFYKVEYANTAFAAEVQEINALCDVVQEVQILQTSTDHTIQEVQLLYLSTTFDGTSAIEVQRVTCDAVMGSFKLSFQGHQTGSIDFNADATAIKAALENLPVIDSVAVSFTGGISQADRKSVV